MSEDADIVWKGECNRRLGAYRPCPCIVCSRNRRGVGYLSWSDFSGSGFTIWIGDEKVFRRLRRALRLGQFQNLSSESRNCNEELQDTAPPKPDRIELLKQIRRATIDDQMLVLEWLNKKFEKIKPENK